MKKIEKYLPLVITVLVLLLFIKSCGISSELTRTRKDIQSLNKKVDSVYLKISQDMKVEGLKAEKRMIQSTDRKILDVQRQTEIDKELKNLGE